ncbi:MAG: DUF4105 domain-containing protein [Planctomycetales bacterium]|nr:DUF4105 domain-containing protein [Planctomycetales bacterium]
MFARSAEPAIPKSLPAFLAVWVVACVCGLSGCRAIQSPQLELPSNQRDWRPELATLATAEFHDDETITVRNIRNCSYFTEDIYVVNHYDKTFDLNRIRAVDFIVVPFKLTPSLAHTMLSFEFAGDDSPATPTSSSPLGPIAGKTEHLAVSVEARLENNESYSPIKGKSKQFELMYVVADERDVLRLRTEHRDVDVYVYRIRTSPERVRNLFVDVMQRANHIAENPEFYDTISNNCTNNIVRHINKLHPGRVPWDPRTLLPGLSDRLAYDLGLLDTSKPFDELKQAAHINEAAKRAANLPEFSDVIRR